MVRDVEADERRVQPHIGFCDGLTEEKGAVRGISEVGLDAVKGGEEGFQAGGIRGLRGGKASCVNAVVNV